MRTESEQCNQQKNGSCEGCPVLYKLRDELRNSTVYCPELEIDRITAARKIALDNCPDGLIPQSEHLIVTRKGNGWTGKYITVNLR